MSPVTSMVAAARRQPREVRQLTALLLGQLATAVLLGVAWWAWAPSSVSYLIDSGNGAGVVIPGESESQVAGDGRFVLLTLVAGLVFGVLAWLLRRCRGPVVPLLLAGGGLVGSLLTLAVGELLGGHARPAKLDAAFHPGLALHAKPAIFLQALLAVLAYTVLAGLASDATLGRPVPAEANLTEPLAEAAVEPVATSTGGTNSATTAETTPSPTAIGESAVGRQPQAGS